MLLVEKVVQRGVNKSLHFSDSDSEQYTKNSIEKSKTKYRGTSFIQVVSLAVV
jgi:hypothetical protein